MLNEKSLRQKNSILSNLNRTYLILKTNHLRIHFIQISGILLRVAWFSILPVYPLHVNASDDLLSRELACGVVGNEGNQSGRSSPAAGRPTSPAEQSTELVEQIGCCGQRRNFGLYLLLWESPPVSFESIDKMALYAIQSNQ